MALVVLPPHPVHLQVKKEKASEKPVEFEF